MPQDAALSAGSGPNGADPVRRIEPSFLHALPHYLPLGVFPLILAAAAYGGWWLLPPILFMILTAPLDRTFGRDGRSLDPAATPERGLVGYNLPVWLWAVLWPATLQDHFIFGFEGSTRPGAGVTAADSPSVHRFWRP